MSITLSPAIRARFGDREYYITTMKAADAARNIKSPDELFNVSASALDQRMQRRISGRVGPMVNYLDQPYRFYGPLIVAIKGGDPQFIPLEMAEPNQLVDSDAFEMGVLRFDGTEDYFVLDGQHRLASIKKAIEEGNNGVKQDDVSLVVIRHEDSEPGVINTRRVFTHLNRYAKATTVSENVTMDEDDGFAIVTRQLVREHPVLKDKIWYKSRQLPQNGKDDGGQIDAKECFTTLETVYNSNKAILRANHTFPSDWERVRPEPEQLDEFTAECKEFWDGLLGIEPISLVASGQRKCSEFRPRTPEQIGKGHFLFRPIGLETLAEAVSAVMQEKDSNFNGIGHICQACARIDWHLESQPWAGLFFGNGKMRSDNTRKRQSVGSKLLRYILGVPWPDADPDLLKEYREAVYPNDSTSDEAMQLKLPPKLS